jgi:adenylate cyclase
MSPQEPDFAAAGLLDGLDGAARAARLQLLRRLDADGCELADLQRAAAADRLTLLPVERLLARHRRHDLESAARTAGVSREYALRNHLAIGLPRPEPGEPVYDDDELENLKVLRGMLDAGLAEEDLHLAGRILGQASRRTAEAFVQVLAQALLQEGDSEVELGVRLADFAEAVLPTLDRMAGAVLRAHLLEVVRGEAITRLEREAGQLAGARTVTVAFADLTGFTALSDRLAVEALGDLAGRFELLVAELAEHPVRLVKVLGDGAMLVSEDTDAIVATVLRAVEEAQARELPPVHAGIAHGPALHSAGDWFGRTVNLAARLCSVAPEHTVLATCEVRDAAGDDLAWDDAGPRRMRGIARPVPTVSPRRARVSGAQPPPTPSSTRPVPRQASQVSPSTSPEPPHSGH